MSRSTSVALAVVLLAACGQQPQPAGAPVSPTASTHASTPQTPHAPAAAPTPSEESPAEAPVVARPAWLGTRILPVRDDGFGEIQPTPPELVDRRLPPPVGGLPDPQTEVFASDVGPVPDHVLVRSTWAPECPVSLDALRYVTVTFWGFDDRPHTGELLVHAEAADDLVGAFEALFEARFPIEEMRVVDTDELDAPPTGDGNNTTAFVCRPTRGTTHWSQHAFGLAVDINPFHNPYVKDDVVLPELASAYTDREHVRPGMIVDGSSVVAAFEDVGWGWGGDWSRPVDPMHFSRSGR